MYEQFFGLNRSPFKITPDTTLFYDGGRRGDVLGALVYAVQRGEGIVKVVGEVGSGKTMLCRMLQQELPKSVEIVYIANPSVSPDDILFVIAHELHLDVAKDASKHEVMHLLQAHLLKRYSGDQQVVLFVEEAQGMPLETLEEIRLLSNLETEQEKLLQIILFGQPELDENLRESSIRQLKERITHEFNLSPLTNDEIHSYLNFRMREVGYTGPELIDTNIAKVIGKYSGGLLRRVNIIADKVLLSAFAEGTHTITKKHVKAAVKDSGFERSVDGKSVNNKGGVIGLIVIALLLLALGGLYWFDKKNKVEQISIPPSADLTPSASVQGKMPDEGLKPTNQPEDVANVDEAVSAQLNQKNHDDSDEKMAADEPARLPAPVEVEDKAGLTDLETDLNSKKKSLDSPQVNTEDVLVQQLELKNTKLKALESEKILSILPKTANITKQNADNINNNDWVTQKIEQSKLWLAQQSNEGVSIQVMMRNKSATDELAQFLREEWPLPLDQTFLYEVDTNGRQIYRVFYGYFLSFSEGQEKLKELPDVVKANSPYLHSIYRMKKTLL